MKQFRRYGALVFGCLFASSAILTVIIYLLRGYGVIGNRSGGMLLFFIVVAIAAGIMFGIEQTKT